MNRPPWFIICLMIKTKNAVLTVNDVVLLGPNHCLEVLGFVDLKFAGGSVELNYIKNSLF